MPIPTRIRTLAKPLAGLAAASLLVAACGEDEDPVEDATVVDPVDTEDELLTPQVDGLEVTVTGNVTELLDDEGFQIDKDGLGTAGDAPPADEVAVDFEDDLFDDDYDLYDYYDYDYDYYDYDYYTAFDGELDDFDESAVVVVTPGGSEVEAGQAVQVHGTLRYYDEATLETAYDIELADDLYGSYEDMYVLVASSVKSVPADRATATGGTATSETADDTTSSTAGEAEETTTTADGSEDTTTTAGDEQTGTETTTQSETETETEG